MKPSPEIDAVVRRFLAARAGAHVDRVRNLFSESPYLRMIGTDGHEWYSGGQAIEVMEAHWEAFGDWDDSLIRLEAFESGESGWAALEGLRTLPDGSKYRYRLTIGLRLEGGTWRFTQLHYSVPVANEETSGVELTRSLAELLSTVSANPPEFIAPYVGTCTIVFTDVVDSTPLSLRLGESAWHVVITAHLDSVKAIVEGAGGSVVKTLGDGGMFVFESGAAALHAAIRIQQEVSKSSNPELSLRVGVHTGDVVLSQDDYVGSAVAKAARVAAAAEGGQILVSSTTVGLVGGPEFHFDEPVTIELKGLDGSHQLRPLTWS